MKETVPVGVLVVPGETSVTVTVHTCGSPAVPISPAMPIEGSHVTTGDVVLRLTVTAMLLSLVVCPESPE